MAKTPEVKDQGTEVQATEPVAAVTVENTATAASPEPVAPVVTTATSEVSSNVTTTVAQAPVQVAGVKKAGMDFEQRIADLKTNGTPNQKTVIAEIETYLDRMRPGRPLSGDVGASYQFSFWMTLSKIVHRMPHDEFKNLWSLVLSYFHQYRDGAFSDRYIYRFAEFWSQPEKQLNAYQRLVNLIKVTADPLTRERGLRQVSMERTLSEGFDEAARQRIIGFYQR